MKKTIAALLTIAAIAYFSTAQAFFAKKNPLRGQANDIWVEMSAEDTKKELIPIPSLAPLVSKVEPAVLVVTTESVVKPRRQQLPPEFERGPFREFMPFFGFPGPQQEYKTKGQGSGFIIHPSGFALTNQHVVEGATKILVKVGTDLHEYSADVIGSDEATDVALIKIKSDRKDWPVIPLGESAGLRVGDFAMAVGNPLGLELSVSFGNVSARGRRDVHPSGRNGLYDFIQIAAPINPGNSGGPLVDMAGRAVGIITAISTQGQGIAFAIPIDQVKRVLPQLKATGKVARSWIGVRIEDVSPELAKSMELKFTHGALIRQVVPGGPGEKAGLEPGDIVTYFDGQIVKDGSSLSLMAGTLGVKKSVPITVVRDKKALTLNITLEEMPREPVASRESIPPKKGEGTSLQDIGITVVNLDDASRSALKLEKGLEGARVAQVSPRSTAAMAGIEENDVIVKLNGMLIDGAKTLASAAAKFKKGDVVLVVLRRGNERWSFPLVIGGEE